MERKNKIPTFDEAFGDIELKFPLEWLSDEFVAWRDRGFKKKKKKSKSKPKLKTKISNPMKENLEKDIALEKKNVEKQEFNSVY